MGADEVCGSGVFTCHVYDDALIIFQRAWMWTRQPERLEDLCAALFYSGVDDKREGAGLSSQSSGWLGARRGGMVPLSCHTCSFLDSLSYFQTH